MGIYGNRKDVIVDTGDFISEDFNIEQEYEMYMAESEIFDSIRKLDNIAINYIYEGVLLEDGGNAIANFVNKVIEAIQNAWNKFKNFIHGTADQPSPETSFLDSIKDKVGQYANTNIVFKNSDILNVGGKFSQVNVVPFSEDMKQYLDSEDNFMQHYYGELMNARVPEGAANSMENRLKLLCSQHVNGKIRIPLKTIYNNATDAFDTAYKSLEADLQRYNDSNNNIKKFIKKIYNNPNAQQQQQQNNNNQQQKQNSTNNTNQSANNNQQPTAQNASFYYNGGIYDLSFLFEKADNNKPAGNDTNKPSMEVEQPGGNQQGGNDANKKESNTAAAQVKVYFNATTKILTAKMNVLKEFRNQNIKALKAVFKDENNAVQQDNGGENSGEGNKKVRKAAEINTQIKDLAI